MALKNINDISKFQQFDHMELIAKEVVEGFITGLHRSPFHGFSVEFAEHRFYNPGESTKNIDWKLFARSDKLFVKQYEEETNLRCQVVIDNSSSMLFPYSKGKQFLLNNLAFSVYSTAALIYLLNRQRDAVGLTLFSEDIDYHVKASLMPVHIDMLYNYLNNIIQPEAYALKRHTNTVSAIHTIAESINKRSLVVIFSDIAEGADLDSLFESLQHLRYNKHEVLLYHVTDHKLEKNFEFSNQPHKFVDLETGAVTRLSPQEIKKSYKSTQESFYTELNTRCAMYGIDMVQANIHDNFDEVLMSFLLKRKKLL
ncbi:MAG: DUF58 domain-containing protein [Bacteroidales bacterium]